MELARFLSSLAAIWLMLATAAAHEVVPSIADMTKVDDVLRFDVRLSLEGVVAGIDLSEVSDTNDAPEAASYDALRALEPDALAQRFRTFWPEMANAMTIRVDGTALMPKLISVDVDPVGNPNLLRSSRIRIEVELPPGSRSVEVGWPARFGALVVRQIGVEEPYDGYLENGQLSKPIPLAGGGQSTAWESLVRYGIAGFDHIIPKGLDHVLFVLGLFFLSARWRPLLWQVSAFTLAHTVTLAASTLGYVSVSPSVVEPIIALSIVYVAVENILSDRLRPTRPLVIFGFGLLHGLGFATVLGEFGLPEGNFIPALIGFNIGVEIGQLAVIAIAFCLVGYWFRDRSWYRSAIAIPGSAIIALIGAYWFVERTIL